MTGRAHRLAGSDGRDVLYAVSAARSIGSEPRQF